MKASIFGNKWQVMRADFAKANSYMQKLSLNPVLANILSCDERLNLQNVEEFLNPKLRNLLKNPFAAFLDIDQAVTRIVKAILKKQKIVIFGDYDVDGACSSAIFKKFFNSIGYNNVLIYIPDRTKEGYGPNTNALLNLKKEGASLVITVDCGTVAFEPLQKASEAGLEVIVVDHHLGVKEKPASIAVINPNRWDETSKFTYLCGAGVSFMVVLALNMTLKKNNFYNNSQEPNLLSLLDLVALGTVCDVMPLIGLNRAFVKTGLEVIKAKTNVGIKALLAVAGSEADVTEFTLGFILGPRINAGGRIGVCDLGARLLSTQSEEEAAKLAQELNDLNLKRREMEDASLEFALQKIEAEELYKNEVIFVKDEAFHQGIIGILAARIKERYNKPVAVFAKAEGYLKASLRSNEFVDVGSIIHKANSGGLLIAGGGHAAAGGLSCYEQNMQALHSFFNEEVKKNGGNFQKVILASANLSLSGLSTGMVEEVAKLAPFGNANPRPLFHLQNLSVVKVDVLKEEHVSFIFKEEETGKTAKAMFFKAGKLGVLPSLTRMIGKKVDVMCEVKLNEWNGRQNLTLHILDISI